MNAIFGIIIAMRVNVLALDDVFDLALRGLDAFQTANELIGMAGLTRTAFEVTVAAAKAGKDLARPPRSRSAIDGAVPDCVVVPASASRCPALWRLRWHDPRFATRLPRCGTGPREAP